MPAVADAQRKAPARPVRQARAISSALLAWYDRERRELPWRSAPGVASDPYVVLLSEIMLQQTTVKAVIPYFERFVARWPSFEALAAADLDDVLAAWAGLGYYSRARNLHACAKAVAGEHGGHLPSSEEALLALPGIGPYTAAAIAAIAFDRRATPVDGNLERVMARLFAIETPLPAAKAELRERARAITPARRAGDWAQALMDLGATVCTPKRPSCLMCPLAAHCAAHARGIEASLPARAARPERPTRHGIAFLALREDGHVLLRRRPDSGLLAGMMELPSTPWIGEWVGADDAERSAPVDADWWPVPGAVVHVFTHFRLELMVFRALVPTGAQLTFWADAPRCRWVPRRDLAHAALPSVMRKAIAHAMKT